jgi:chromate reductase
LLQQPEAFVHYEKGLFGDDGSVTDESVAKFLGNFVEKYLAWVKRFIV